MGGAMSYCANCGKELPEGGSFCPNCGEKLTPSPLVQPLSKITDEEFAAFIGKNADRYLLKFKKFNIGGIDSFSLTWHWPAFFAGFFWMLYRKMYLWALVVFAIEIFIPYVGFLTVIVLGVCGNYIYYAHAKKKILELRSIHPTEDISAALSRIGGVNKWVWVVAIIFWSMIIGAIIAFVLSPVQ